MSEYAVKPPAFRLPADTTVGPVRLQISDRSRSIAYYANILGMQVAGETPLIMRAHDGRPLIELDERPGARAVPQAGVLGLYHFAILLPDRISLGRFVRHLSRLGVQFGAADHLVSEAIYLWDPDGLGIEVYADRPRDQWRVRDGQLAMATDPLDFESLIAAAGDESWVGMPAGTTMGHVHLQVGELDQARDFYHSALGLDVTVSSYPGALFLSAGGYHHHLGVNTWARRARAATPDDAQLLEWQLRLPSQDAVERAAQSLGRDGYEISAMDGDRVVVDPWATRLRLSSG